MQRGQQVQARDPFWLLARQWQMREFSGADDGSPATVTAEVENRNVTVYRPGTDAAKTVEIDATLPLETHVEREKIILRLRGAVQLGVYFETLARSRAVADTTIARFRLAFAIPKDPPEPLYAPPEALRFRHLVSGRVTDGGCLYEAAPGLLSGQAPPPPLQPGDITDAVKQSLNDLVSLRGLLFTEPSHDSAWISTQLNYDFAVGSPVAHDNLLLRAPEFHGDRLDWYSFSMANGERTKAASDHPAKAEPTNFNLLPNDVVFQGMPATRFWTFDDELTDFSQLDIETVDLPKLMMEFAWLYGADWFWVNIPITVGVPGAPDQPRGTLSRITSLIVTDTFGVRTLIRSAEQTAVNASKPTWSMFKVSGQNTRSEFIFMPPSLAVVENAAPLEKVLFLRDDLAALGWAVEHKLQGDLDTAVDAYQLYSGLQQAKQSSNTAPPSNTTPEPQLTYAVETLPPRNWIPMVPVQAPDGALYFRRGTMALPSGQPSSPELVKLTPHALLLEPDQKLFVADHVISSAGVQVGRYFRRARSYKGENFLWLARKTSVGHGMGWSGLRYDSLSTPAKT
jgi:hypothetical protein